MEEITKEWLIEKMEANDINNRELAKKLGVLEAQVSRWKNGKVILTNQTKSQLYYFFRCLGLEKELNK